MTTGTRAPVAVPWHRALAGTDEARVAAAPVLAAAPTVHRKPVDAASAALGAAFGALPEELRATAPLYVLCRDYGTWAARRFIARCHDPARRLRPSDSVGLETSELVRPYLTAAEHRGDCYLLAQLTAAQAEFTPPVTAARPAAVVLDLIVFPGEDPRDADCLALATTWKASGL
ncbi:hypothetical protein [Streptomyces sp. 3211]|uniref:hypothetical protein n=1 Tax=Streptomyces sp. 3211 TaxID=1964449 RepID=UPI0013315C8D|nr:hypothetical protein [Streptomyces sp. 3211]